MEVDAVTLVFALGTVAIAAIGYGYMKLSGRHDIEDAIDKDNAKEERVANATDVKFLQKEVADIKNK